MCVYTHTHTVHNRKTVHRYISVLEHFGQVTNPKHSPDGIQNLTTFIKNPPFELFKSLSFAKVSVQFL